MKRFLLASMLAGLALAQAPAAPEDDRLGPLTRSRALRLARPDAPPGDSTNRVADDPQAARLGQMLFFDARLSGNGKVACSSCHDPAHAFTDAKPLSDGVGRSSRNAPTVLDAAFARWHFWDGRADSLWSQALAPIEHPSEMDGSRVDVARLLRSDGPLRGAYEKVFGVLPDVSDARRFARGARPEHDVHRGAEDEPAPREAAWLAMDPKDRRAVNTVFANVGKAIAAYERRLSPRGSPFDRYLDALKRDDAAAEAQYPAAARRGLALFLGRAACRSCHGGPFFTDGEFHNIGVPALDRLPPRDPGRHRGIELVQSDVFNAHGPYSDDREGERAQLLGALARPPELWGAFRTPSLRNVARTAPYMHQGQFATLKDVVHFYSTLEGAVPAGHHGERVLRALNLTAEDQSDLVAFLETLTDPPLPEELLRALP